MVEIKVQMEGLKELQEAFRKAPKLSLEETSKAVQKTVLTLQKQSMKEAPVNKQSGGGNLRQNIRSKMTSKLSGVVEAKANYSIFVHEGTAPHEIRPVNARVLANKRTGEFFGKLVHHPGTRPNPFFIRAINASKKQITEFFNQAVVNVFKIFPK